MSKANVLLLSALLFFTVQSSQFETNLLQTFSQSKELANHPTGKVIKSYIALVSHLSEVTDRSVKYKQLYTALDLIRSNLIETKEEKIKQIKLDYTSHTGEIAKLEKQRDTAKSNYDAASSALTKIEEDLKNENSEKSKAISEQTRLQGLIDTAKDNENTRKEEYEKETTSVDSAISEAKKAKELLIQLIGDQKTVTEYSFLETANQNRKQFLQVIQTKIANFYKSGPFALQRTIVSALIQAASNQDKFTDQVTLSKVIKLVDDLIQNLESHKNTIETNNTNDLESFTNELSRLNGLLQTEEKNESDATSEITRLEGEKVTQTKTQEQEDEKFKAAQQDIIDENSDWANKLATFKKFIKTYDGELVVLDNAETKLTDGGIKRPSDVEIPVDNLKIPEFAV